jgi:hypothetical protein
MADFTGYDDSVSLRLILRAIAAREAAGLSIRAYGAEGYTPEQPFTCHATTAEQRDAWRATLERRGFTVEGV